METALQDKKMNFINVGVIPEHNINWYNKEIARLQNLIQSLKKDRKIAERENKSTVGYDRVIADYIDRIGRYQKWINVCEKQEERKFQEIRSLSLKTK